MGETMAGRRRFASVCRNSGVLALALTAAGCAIKDKLAFYVPPVAGPTATLDVHVAHGLGNQFVDIGQYDRRRGPFYAHLVALGKGAGARASVAIPAGRKVVLRYIQSDTKPLLMPLVSTFCWMPFSLIAQPGQVLHLHAAIVITRFRRDLLSRILSFSTQKYDRFYSCHLTLYRDRTMNGATGKDILFHRATRLANVAPQTVNPIQSDADGDYDADHDDDDDGNR